MVKVVVGVNSHGEPSSVNLLQSTGNAELDRLFMRWVRENWTFYPAEKDGVPIAFQGGGARQAEYRLTCTRKYKDASGEDRE